MDPSFPTHPLGPSNKYPPQNPQPTKSATNPIKSRYDNDIMRVTQPLQRSPTKTLPRSVFHTSPQKSTGGIPPEDQPALLSKIAKKESQSYIIRRKAPRSPDSASGPDPIFSSIEGSLNSFDTLNKERRSLRGHISFKKNLGEGVSGKVHLATLTGPAAVKPAVTKGMKENAEDINKPKQVAVKSYIQDDKNPKVDREISIVKMMMTNPPKGIPRIHGILQIDDTHQHVVMKHCNKGNFSDFFNQNVSDKNKCYKSIVDTMKIVEKYHKAGFCHRDIWEENLLRHEKKKSGEIVNFLTDFGHAENMTNLPKDGIGPDDENTMSGIPLQLLNCPRYVAKAWREAGTFGDYNDYQDLIDEKGAEIDRFQIGMMLFRLASSKESHIARAELNKMQMELVRFLENLQSSEHKTDPHTPKDIASFLEMHHHTIPEPIRVVITGLLDTSKQMELTDALKILADFIRHH